LLVNLGRFVENIRPRIKGRVGVTNGIFDLFHVGHLSHLWICKKYCDCLVVLVNSDKSATNQKRKPTISEQHRARLIDEVNAVDFTIIFDEQTASDAVRAIKPEAYLKGIETRERLPEEDACVEVGAEIIYTGPKIESTTEILERSHE